MAQIVRAIVEAYDPQAQTADVRLEGAGGLLDGLALAGGLAAADLEVGDRVVLALWTDVGGVVLARLTP